jgi:hypothetical protein
MIMKTTKEKIVKIANENLKHIIDLCAEIGDGLRSNDDNEVKLAAALARVAIDFLKDDAVKLAFEMVTHKEYQH